jgi:UTP:GlnB (protein PII) uridylyltransferase
MPERYRASFDDETIQKHAAIVARRAGFSVHLEVWQRLAGGGVAICVVADDRPGLLSFVSASLVANDIDIVAVKAYTRSRPEARCAEAVDFLWVERKGAPPIAYEQADMDRIGSLVAALISGETTVASVLSSDRPLSRAPEKTPTRVTFEAKADEGSDVLTVETSDCPGLLLTITQALYRAGVQIVASDAATRGGRVADRFTIVEQDGTRIVPARRRTVQKEVVSAIESLVDATSGGGMARSPTPGKPPR